MRLYIRDDCNKSAQTRLNSLTFRNIYTRLSNIKRLFLRNGKNSFLEDVTLVQRNTKIYL